ncbi:hypothetical protein SAMN04488500_10683 [Sporomusa malonica]|uniref:Uncharacterized protein n=1 Tax=Sporomusa malonica TaxID=112901 RepID=A0A1W2ASH8_9FIRM|nr:hypothetical protein SAMN04488500_10683 [Sporomusa malonica]
MNILPINKESKRRQKWAEKQRRDKGGSANNCPCSNGIWANGAIGMAAGSVKAAKR